jgi:hypothetical protein
MAFTGRAIYGTNIFRGVAEDVADVVGLISPYETPLLDRLGDADRPASNVLHEWMTDALNPNTVVSTSTVNTAATAIAILDLSNNAVANYFMVGDVLKDNVTGEYIQITAIAGNTITITRAFGGTTAATITQGDNLFVISSAALEGADVSVDISRGRVRNQNYTQIFKKDVIISGTLQAVTELGGITDEMDYQKTNRLREALRDLEKAAINGILSGNSLGSSSAYRTMNGIWNLLTTNSYSVATLTESWLNTAIQGAWENGATDLDLIVADANYKRIIDQFNSSRIHNFQGDGTYEAFRNRVSYYECSFGVMEVLLGRWMPQNSAMIISSQRIHVPPLQGRSFRFEPVSRTGDAEKGMIIGEYTVEVWNQEGMAKVYSPTGATYSQP